MSVMAIRTRIRDDVEAAYKVFRGWIAKYPLVTKVYYLFSWFSLLFFVASLVFMRDSRIMLVQYLWSFYVTLQFWLLCRSKTMAWKQFSLFVFSGVIFVVPFTNLTLQFFHWIFGGVTSDTWSIAVVTPIFEELWKLLPLGAFLLFSRRATSLSLSDYALLGAAPGIGFQFMEELSRRWVNDGQIARQYDYSTTMLGGKTIHWDLISLFPGRYEESFFPTMMNVIHPVHTAMIALGLGFAFRFRKKLLGWGYSIPVLLLLWSILDHAAWNGQGRFPDWIMQIHEWTGSGYHTRGFFLIVLIVALGMDYFALNKIRQKLPGSRSELFIDPFTELWNLAAALLRDRKRFGILLTFYRQRRELAFSNLYGNEEARSRIDSIQEKIYKYAGVLGFIGVIILAAGLLTGLRPFLFEQDSACFACLFDSLQNWWDRLSGWEQAAIVLGAFALAFMFTGFWPALGMAMTGMGIAEGGHEIAGYIRDPKKLLSPQNAIAVAVAILLSRIPAGKGLKWLSERLGPRARKVLDKLKPRSKPKPESEPVGGSPGKKEPPSSEHPKKEPPEQADSSGLTEPTTSGGAPKGNYEKPDPKDPRPITRQNEAADLLAEKGYDIEMLPGTKGGNGYGIKPESNPDFLINGKPFDCYSPDTSKVRNIWAVVEGKTQKQAGGIILNLDDYTGSMDALMKQFNDWPIEGLDELLIIKDGSIKRWFP